ncbi:glycosyl transferase [Mycolicibacterium murale]|uniref:Glycosyl transferase n=1 Tax=Mycolicibacterium murale TaxID=182220 RepID=A0A7I9WUH7_9MYCO|nr:glycosyltransferase [Mycolicibacterium murale]MCV7185739.1 glycosyltransferase [Mycolicibacterium murale]GFG61395.1 glycosyl transferase [Mycolicibacterium murale]
MPSVAIIGTRGYPSYYGGFETAVRKLSPYLVEKGWDVTVYGRKGSTRPSDPNFDPRVSSVETIGLETKSLSTLSYGLTASLDTLRRRPDVALVMNVANGYFLPILRTRNIPTLVNVDGIEWERAKWSPLAKRVFRTGAVCSARWSTKLVFDARAIEQYWQRTFRANGVFIPYGGDVPPLLPTPHGLTHRGYVLLVARFVPENSVPEFFKAVPVIAESYPVVIVGSSGYAGDLEESARKLSSEFSNVNWMGHVSDDSLLLSLWQHAGVYFHGHSVGGTNPALVQAMAAGAPIVARDTVYNREVLGTGGRYVAADPSNISQEILRLMGSVDELDQLHRDNIHRAESYYSWTQVCGAYEQSLRDILPH